MLIDSRGQTQMALLSAPATIGLTFGENWNGRVDHQKSKFHSRDSAGALLVRWHIFRKTNNYYTREPNSHGFIAKRFFREITKTHFRCDLIILDVCWTVHGVYLFSANNGTRTYLDIRSAMPAQRRRQKKSIIDQYWWWRWAYTYIRNRYARRDDTIRCALYWNVLLNELRSLLSAIDR